MYGVAVAIPYILRWKIEGKSGIIIRVKLWVTIKEKTEKSRTYVC